jgi:hypothetical protein
MMLSIKLVPMHSIAIALFMPFPQGRALSELRSLEETSASLVSAIQEGALAKRQLLDDLIEAERQIMLSERKIQLEREMQVGGGRGVRGMSCRSSQVGSCATAAKWAGACR